MITLGDNNNVTLRLGSDEVLKAYLGDEQVYPNTQPTPSYEQYLTFKSLEDDNTITFKLSSSSSPAKTISVSTDGGKTWTGYTSTTGGATIATLNMGEKVLIKGNNSAYSDGYGYNYFRSTKEFNVQGNIMSLISGDNFKGQTDLTGKDYAFYRLFSDNTKLINADKLSLPATTLAEGCYFQMFYECTALTTTPVLPAETLAQSCYDGMFYSCSSLTTAPELPATTLAGGCYNDMFRHCISLTSAPVLPATILTKSCYNGMFYNCSSLTTAPELSATTLAKSCYNGMFQNCTSLTTAPELPAETLADSCYHYMFNGCTKLNYIKAMFTTTPSDSYTYNWVNGVSATGTFVKNSDATWNVTGVSGVPEGWTIKTEHAKINKKYRATYTNGTTVDGECDGNNLVINEVTKSGLKTVVIGECVPAIVGECFSDCADLTSVIIEGNTSIDNYSFARNNGHLTSITMYSTTPPPCQSTAFTYFNGSSYVPMTSITIYVPAASLNTYKKASGWSKYSTKIRAIS